MSLRSILTLGLAELLEHMEVILGAGLEGRTELKAKRRLAFMLPM